VIVGQAWTSELETHRSAFPFANPAMLSSYVEIAPADPWETDMSDAVAHLTSAREALEDVELPVRGPFALLASYELDRASHSIDVALAALDECAHLSAVATAPAALHPEVASAGRTSVHSD
jgi:hypothetical protein